VASRFDLQTYSASPIYKRPYDPKHPVVCFDETNKQLVKENKTPLVAELGQVERYDYEYGRC
jgi:hypothetical protein